MRQGRRLPRGVPEGGLGRPCCHSIQGSARGVHGWGGTKTKLYGKYIVLGKNGEPLLYVKLQKALYGLLQSALMFYKKLVEDLTANGFKLNPATATKASPAADHLSKIWDETGATFLDKDCANTLHHATAQLGFLRARSRPDIDPAEAFLKTRVHKPDEYILKWWVDTLHCIHEDCKGLRGSSCHWAGEQAASWKQKIDVRSSTEDELVGLDDALPLILWLPPPNYLTPPGISDMAVPGLARLSPNSVQPTSTDLPVAPSLPLRRIVPLLIKPRRRPTNPYPHRPVPPLPYCDGAGPLNATDDAPEQTCQGLPADAGRSARDETKSEPSRSLTRLAWLLVGLRRGESVNGEAASESGDRRRRGWNAYAGLDVALTEGMNGMSFYVFYQALRFAPTSTPSEDVREASPVAKAGVSSACLEEIMRVTHAVDDPAMPNWRCGRVGKPPAFGRGKERHFLETALT
ncbi:hypothetical protein THAOC_27248 [Thalassiosira oceanica]|uniref:Reverse transcriptase Ty1/copia-type domain-containing protein n=1 Tax=Thalassiosira oceanica TaxID=159749 RepID=K0RHZ2_THAOC|nr:hypothetical protein THAOC_27248 [Thalassiosira oceanica]|eukprot:EJK53338.1 hypothetical protein THAOC_27248 [Thalassiosira oceanica]